MSKHSPGPWEWKYGHRHVWSSAGHPVIEATDDRDGYSSRCRIVCPNPADAALIASAPTIAARLDEAVGLLRECRRESEATGDISGGTAARIVALLAAIDAEKAREGT